MLFGILAIIFSIFIFLSLVPELTNPYRLQTFLALVSSFCWFIFGIGVIKRFSWARIGIIITAIVYIVDTFEQPRLVLEVITNHDFITLGKIIIGLIFFSSTIYFFTRKTIKDQFKKNKVKKGTLMN